MLKNIKIFLTKYKKVAMALMIVATVMMIGTMCFATEGTVASSLDFTGITDALTSAVTPADILAIIAKVIGYCIPFVLAWFGFRFLWSKFRGAVTRGRM